MRLTTKRRYAVTAALDLALHRGSAPISLASLMMHRDVQKVAERQERGRPYANESNLTVFHRRPLA